VQLPDLPRVFTRSQALALGVSDLRLAGAVRRGELTRLRQGTYAVGRATAAAGVQTRGTFAARRLHHLAEAEAALIRHPNGYALSHLSAAIAHGLPMPLNDLKHVHLTVDGGVHRSRRPDGVVVHHGDSLEMKAVLADGLPCTSVARTLADCLRWNVAAVSVPLVDHAVRLGQCAIDEILAELSGQSRWRGRPRAYTSLAIVDGRRETWLESFGYTSLAGWGIELPTPQVVVLTADGDFIARVDGLWGEDNTVLELDGKAKYLDPAAGADPLDAELVRQHGLTNVGLEVVRTDLAGLLKGTDLGRDITGRRAVGRNRTFTGQLVIPSDVGLRWVGPD
jgi:hypothetical protein